MADYPAERPDIMSGLGVKIASSGGMRRIACCYELALSSVFLISTIIFTHVEMIMYEVTDQVQEMNIVFT